MLAFASKHCYQAQSAWENVHRSAGNCHSLLMAGAQQDSAFGFSASVIKWCFLVYVVYLWLARDLLSQTTRQ